jgi:hypothetical protein
MRSPKHSAAEGVVTPPDRVKRVTRLAKALRDGRAIAVFGIAIRQGQSRRRHAAKISLARAVPVIRNHAVAKPSRQRHRFERLQ